MRSSLLAWALSILVVAAGVWYSQRQKAKERTPPPGWKGPSV